MRDSKNKLKIMINGAQHSMLSVGNMASYLRTHHFLGYSLRNLGFYPLYRNVYNPGNCFTLKMNSWISIKIKTQDLDPVG